MYWRFHQNQIFVKLDEAVFRNRPSLQELEQCSFRQRHTFMRVLQIMKQSRSQEEKKDGIYD